MTVRNWPRTLIDHLGLSTTDYVCHLRNGLHDPGHSARYSLLPGRGSRTLDTPCIWPDYVLYENGLGRVDVLKLDCQGSEYEILYGASAQTLAMMRRLVCEGGDYEGQPGWSVAALGAYLTRQGFSTATRGALLYAERTA